MQRVLTFILALLGLCAPVLAYDRELRPEQLREGFYLGKNDKRYNEFARDYAKTFPLPKEGIHIERVEVRTPFKEMVDRARRAADGYSPVTAEADYKKQPPPLIVEVTLKLTPSFPAHTPHDFPVAYGPVYFRDANFWEEFDVHLVQRGDIMPEARTGRPIESCDTFGGCILVGAVVTYIFDPDRVASRPATVVVLSPDGQKLEAEFDLDRLK
ncbi:MAG TPA: hypothetical protein VNN18_05515 [Candidatus Xenobia bacterium]|nr:hypothetical protein [Candidatus Xenobia bacterium]